MSLTARIHDSVGAIAAADWDALAGQGTGLANPFVSHAFLTALEESGSVGGKAIAVMGDKPLSWRIPSAETLRCGTPGPTPKTWNGSL